MYSRRLPLPGLTQVCLKLSRLCCELPLCSDLLIGPSPPAILLLCDWLSWRADGREGEKTGEDSFLRGLTYDEVVTWGMEAKYDTVGLCNSSIKKKNHSVVFNKNICLLKVMSRDLGE